ncbi:MAG TPA: transcriptional regulator GcvA [Casimicrobiaceae bacterium]|jgi:LysR family glycine cleavage system transcriptional activator|nr:transcriptional regulator GcvA [Casimicrobiaceae bacterium]
MTPRIPPMQALRAFEAVASMGSLTQAADALSLTHGAISHQIKSLESMLGVRLVERAGRGIRITDSGARLASRVRAALADIADAIREASERTSGRKLRVSVTPSFAARWLLPRLGSFIRQHPDIDLDVRAGSALVDFQRDDVDVAIRWGVGQWPGVKAEELLRDVFFPVCSPRLPNLPRVPSDLASHTLLRSDDEFWKPWFDAVGLDWPEPDRGPIFNDSSLMLQAAVDVQGIALARASLIGSDIRNGLLMRLFDIDVPGPRRYYLVYPPRMADSPKLALFRAWLHDEIATETATTPPRKRTATTRRKRGNAR